MKPNKDKICSKQIFNDTESRNFRMTKLARICRILFLCLALSPSILTAPLSAQVKSYLLGTNDVLHIIVYAGGEVQYEGDLTVSDMGTINPPFIGSITARGLTTDQLQVKIYEPLAKDYFVDPRVIVQVKEYHAIQYYISGAVNKPGMYTSTSNISIMELIAKAEGAKSDHGRWAYILRGEDGRNQNESITQKEPIKVDLQKLLEKGDISANPSLKPSIRLNPTTSSVIAPG